MEKSIDKLEKEVTCPVCQELYEDPKVLPCLHYYCKQCILKLALRTSSGDPFLCPECRSEATLPEGGIDNMKSAFFINRLKSTFEAMEMTQDRVQMDCEGCTLKEAKAEAFCRQCALFICQRCVTAHHRMKIFRTHQVSRIEDLKRGGASNSSPAAAGATSSQMCSSHREPTLLYCFDCEKLICRDCTVKDHKDHQFEFNHIAAPKTKTELLKQLEPLKELSTGVSRAMEDVKATKHDIRTQGSSIADEIQTSFHVLQDMIEKCKMDLLEEADMKVSTKMKTLSEQEKWLSTLHAEIQSVVECAEHCVQLCSDDEVMSLHGEISRRIEREVKEHHQSGRSMEPVEKADMGVEVSCAHGLQQLLLTNAKIYELPIDLCKCTLTLQGGKMAEVDQCATDIVTIVLANSKPAPAHTNIESSLKSVLDGSITKCNVAKSEGNAYSLQYTPSIRGQHELLVAVNGEQLPGTPYPVYVSSNPAQLGSPIKIQTGLSKPTGITVNSSQEVLVTEYGGYIKIFKNNKCSKILYPGIGQLVDIAVDVEDNVYAVSFDTNVIIKINKANRIHKKRVRQGYGPGHLGVSVFGEDVLVCERHNKGTVVVYSRKLCYLKQLIVPGGGELHNVARDDAGNLYITDWTNSCIQVMSTDGDILRSFGSEGGISMPYYISLAGQYLFVTSFYNDCVSIFTTGGKYVSSFGQRGGGEGDFSDLRGVFVDKNGFIYVCDYNNCRYQVM